MYKNREQLEGIMASPQPRVVPFFFVESQWVVTHIAGRNWKPAGQNEASSSRT